MDHRRVEAGPQRHGHVGKYPAHRGRRVPVRMAREGVNVRRLRAAGVDSDAGVRPRSRWTMELTPGGIV